MRVRVCEWARVCVYYFCCRPKYLIFLRPAFEQEAYTRGPEHGCVINKHLLQQSNCRRFTICQTQGEIYSCADGRLVAVRMPSLVQQLRDFEILGRRQYVYNGNRTSVVNEAKMSH